MTTRRTSYRRRASFFLLLPAVWAGRGAPRSGAAVAKAGSKGRRSWALVGGVAKMEHRAQARSLVVEARQQRLRPAVRSLVVSSASSHGAGQRRLCGSSSASSGVETGEGDEVRHQPPRALALLGKIRGRYRWRGWQVGPLTTVANGVKKTIHPILLSVLWQMATKS